MNSRAPHKLQTLWFIWAVWKHSMSASNWNFMRLYGKFNYSAISVQKFNLKRLINKIIDGIITFLLLLLKMLPFRIVEHNSKNFIVSLYRHLFILLRKFYFQLYIFTANACTINCFHCVFVYFMCLISCQPLINI